MYNEFVSLRNEARIRQCMSNQKQSDECRAQFARGMLENYEGDLKDALHFAVAFFGPMEDSAKVQYLLKTPMHFDLLHQWCPDHNMVALKPFTSKEGDFQGMSGQDFTCASKLLVEAHSVTFVQHPVARSLLVSFQNAQKLLGDRPQASAILEACFRECASLKLPLPPFFESSLPEELSQFDDKDCSKRSSRVLLCSRF